MVSKDRWKYDTTITLRLEKATKDRLWQAAAAKRIPFSEHIRSILKDGKLPEELLGELPSGSRARVEKLAARTGKDAASMLMELIPTAIPSLFDNTYYGV